MLRLVLFSCCVVLCVAYENCGRNEEMKCVQPCPPQKTCSNRDIQFSCIQVVQPCDHICACKPGFLRNDLGECITNEECVRNSCEYPYCRYLQPFDCVSSRMEHLCNIIETCQGENEFFDCGSACDNECATLSTQNRTNCPIVNIVCNRKCYCKDGFARDKENKCVPVEKCHSQNDEDSLSKINDNVSRVRRYADTTGSICTGENEEYTDCKKSCPPNTCLSILARFKCDSKEPCKTGCVCKSGYLRLQPDSPCIPICQCPEMRNALECQNDVTTKE